MSLNHHGLPSRVPVIAELGRVFGDPHTPEADKLPALELLVQDHADLDEVEAHSALWAISQLSRCDAARDALLSCADIWLTHADTAPLWLDCYSVVCGMRIVPGAAHIFARLHRLAQRDTELAARLQAFSAT